MTAPHQSRQRSAFPERPYPQEPHQPYQQPVHPPVAPGQHLRPWPATPEQPPQGHAYQEQAYRLPPHQDPQSGRHAAEEQPYRPPAYGQAPSAGLRTDTGSLPILVPLQRHVALAWSALALGVVGGAAAGVGAVVGSSIAYLGILTIGIAGVGALLGLIALLGTRKALAGIGVVLCAAAIVFTVMSPVVVLAAADDGGGGEDAAAQDVTVGDCAVVDRGGEVVSEGTIEITNGTDQRQSYNVSLSVNDENDRRVGEIIAIATDVAPGQTVVLSGADATGTANERSARGPADCRVTNVNRLALGR